MMNDHRFNGNPLSLQEVEAAGIEPPEYPETLEYNDATGRTMISELRNFDVAVTDTGLDEWQHLIRRVAPSRFVALWRVANRLRATAVEALVGGRGRQRERELEQELAQSREEAARLLRELEVRDANCRSRGESCGVRRRPAVVLLLFVCCWLYLAHLYILGPTFWTFWILLGARAPSLLYMSLFWLYMMAWVPLLLGCVVCTCRLALNRFGR
ncbi:uncharacterized protein LOC141616891 [Silene latifolia]|uniref:uncharacterized protein LOC141616891 n=1 Tax=Silene latifolia TaxID=37657 RepID=UPI003D77EA9A